MPAPAVTVAAKLPGVAPRRFRLSFAEVFLRLGLSLVGWMVLYAHFLWLAAVQRIGCGPDGDEMYGLLLGFAPVTFAFAFAVRLTRPFPDIHGILRWLGVPLILLAPLCLASTWPVFSRVHLEAASICAALPPPAWQQAWVATQIATVVLVLAVIVIAWRQPRDAG